MSRYIDAEPLEHKSPKLRALILEQPTADVEPVRHSRWEDFEQHSWAVNPARRCQICGWIVTFTQSIAFAYCPNCGARMDRKEKRKDNE